MKCYVTIEIQARSATKKAKTIIPTLIQILGNNEGLRLYETTLLTSDIRLVSNLHSSQHDPNLPQYIGINVKDHTNQTPADSRYVVAQNKT